MTLRCIHFHYLRWISLKVPLFNTRTMIALRPRLRLVIKSRYCQLCFVFSVFILFVIKKQDNLFRRSVVKEHIASFQNSSNKLHSDTEREPKSAKILCYILLSRAKVRTALLIRETWGSHCDDVIFFGGFEYPKLPVTYLNTSEGYENLWGKAKAALLYLAGDSRFREFEYFLKADDDTFVIVENLRKFLRNAILKHYKAVWLGFKLKHRRMPQGYMSGGAGYVFNYKALEKVTNILKPTSAHTSPAIKDIRDKCNTDGEYGIEDLELGKCFHAAGVESVNTTDGDGKERFLPLSYDALLNGAISSYHWIWRQAWNRIKTGGNCCSQDLISMHEISPSQMKLIYFLIYKTDVWKERIDWQR